MLDRWRAALLALGLVLGLTLWPRFAAAAEALPFVDPATGLLVDALRVSQVVARLGEPTRRHVLDGGTDPEADPAKTLRLDYPGLSLSFSVLASQRPKPDPLVAKMSVRKPLGSVPPPPEGAAHPAHDAVPRWVVEHRAADGPPAAGGLHIGMDGEAFDALVKRSYRIVFDTGPQSEAAETVILTALTTPKAGSLRVRLEQGRVRSLDFAPNPSVMPVQLQPPYVIYAVVAAIALALIPLALYVLKLARRKWGDDGHQPAPGWAQLPLHLVGLPMLAVGCWASVMATIRLSDGSSYGEKVGALYMFGALLALMLAAGALIRSKYRLVVRVATVLFIWLALLTGIASLAGTFLGIFLDWNSLGQG